MAAHGRCLAAALALAAVLAAVLAVASAAETGGIFFPPEINARQMPSPATSSRRAPKQIPLDILRELNAVSNVTYFLNTFVDSQSLVQYSPDGDLIGNRFGGEERKSVQTAKPALCEPHLEVVSLIQGPVDPSLYYYPTCTRVERCGGCCGSTIMSCQPVETEMVNFQVIKTQYTGDFQMEFKGHEITPIERHLKCQCDCSIKEADCNQFQEYRSSECACVCMNTDEQDKCNSQSETKVWDASTCSCQCRESRECSSGFYYDADACKCLRVPRTRRGN